MDLIKAYPRSIYIIAEGMIAKIRFEHPLVHTLYFIEWNKCAKMNVTSKMEFRLDLFIIVFCYIHRQSKMDNPYNRIAPRQFFQYILLYPEIYN
jgi:hypothetical protein